MNKFLKQQQQPGEDTADLRLYVSDLYNSHTFKFIG